MRLMATVGAMTATRVDTDSMKTPRSSTWAGLAASPSPTIVPVDLNDRRSPPAAAVPREGTCLRVQVT